MSFPVNEGFYFHEDWSLDDGPRQPATRLRRWSAVMERWLTNEALPAGDKQCVIVAREYWRFTPNHLTIT